MRFPFKKTKSPHTSLSGEYLANSLAQMLQKLEEMEARDDEWRAEIRNSRVLREDAEQVPDELNGET